MWTMHPVFAFLDYRAYLRSFVEERKGTDGSFSQRGLAAALGVDAGQLVRILQGKNQLSTRFVPAMARLAEMDARAAAYFEELLRYASARGDEESARSLDRLLALRGVMTHPLAGSQAQYYSCWKHAVVCALIGIAPWRGSAAALGSMVKPPLSRQEVEESLLLLESLHLVRHERDGAWAPVDAHLSPGADVPAAVLRAYHAQIMENACAALEATPSSERDFSTLTLALDGEGMGRLRELSRALRQRIQSHSNRSLDADRVFQINIQIFPVARRAEVAA
jgi:uncharacterized protein (TIGR02147 family)